MTRVGVFCLARLRSLFSSTPLQRLPLFRVDFFMGLLAFLFWLSGDRRPSTLKQEHPEKVKPTGFRVLVWWVTGCNR